MAQADVSRQLLPPVSCSLCVTRSPRPLPRLQDLFTIPSLPDTGSTCSRKSHRACWEIEARGRDDCLHNPEAFAPARSPEVAAFSLRGRDVGKVHRTLTPPPDPGQCMPGLVVSVSQTGRAGQLLREESAGAGCELTARDCCWAGGYSLGSARSRLAILPRGRSAPGDGESLACRCGRGRGGLAPKRVRGKRSGTA